MVFDSIEDIIVIEVFACGTVEVTRFVFGTVYVDIVIFACRGIDVTTLVLGEMNDVLDSDVFSDKVVEVTRVVLGVYVEFVILLFGCTNLDVTGVVLSTTDAEFGIVELDCKFIEFVLGIVEVVFDIAGIIIEVTEVVLGKVDDGFDIVVFSCKVVKLVADIVSTVLVVFNIEAFVCGVIDETKSVVKTLYEYVYFFFNLSVCVIKCVTYNIN